MTGAWDDKGCKLSFIVAIWIGATDEEELLLVVDEVEHSEDILEVVTVLDADDVIPDGDIAKELEAIVVTEVIGSFFTISEL